MRAEKLCREMEKKIALCKEEYERVKEDSYLSIVRSNELETLQTLCERFRGGGSKEKMREELNRRLAELEEAKEHEAEYPTFDWYGEHYHYEVLEGACNAYRSAIELLEMEDEAAC